jgi:hypothetical protein
MFGTYFYHNTIRNLVVAFGSLFNNISVSRKDSAGVETERIKVPLSYANKEKFLRRIRQNPTLDQNLQMSLPRMSFDFTSLNYDPARKRNTTLRKFVEDDTSTRSKLKSMYMEVPYNLDFTLYLATRHMEDGLQILEQILPYFTPEFTVTLKLQSDFASKVDVPIILNSANSEHDYEGTFDDTRTLMWTLEFTMKANIYSPIKTSGIILESGVVFKNQNMLGEPRGTTGAALSRTIAGVTGTATSVSGGSADDYGSTNRLDLFLDFDNVDTDDWFS